jgi:hypothetical protein
MASEIAGVHDDCVSGRTRCLHCGSYATQRFARVFGDNDNDLYACLECTTMRALRNGEGVCAD